MRTWLLTNTTYGTWLPGDRRGSVTSVRERRVSDPTTKSRIEHDLPGTVWEAPIAGLRRSSAALLKGSPILLDRQHAVILLAQFLETVAYRGWSMQAVSIMPNHFHLVVSVPGDPDPRRLLIDLKAYGSRALNAQFGRPPSRTWWTTNGSKRKLADEAAVRCAVFYVLHKQPNPLVTWSPDRTDGEPQA